MDESNVEEEKIAEQTEITAVTAICAFIQAVSDIFTHLAAHPSRFTEKGSVQDMADRGRPRDVFGISLSIVGAIIRDSIVGGQKWRF